MAKKAKAPVSVLNVGGIRKTSSIEFLARNRRSEQYQPVIEKMLSLKADKEGQSFDVSIPGTTAKTLHNRLNAAFRRAGVYEKAPKGYRFTKRTEKGTEKVIVSLEPAKGD